MRSDGSEQPRALPDDIREDPETDDEDIAVYLVPMQADVDIAAARDVLRALPGVTGVSVDLSDNTIMVWGRRDMLSDQELAAAMEDATAEMSDTVGE
jgi:copper chaperone CopZ